MTQRINFEVFEVITKCCADCLNEWSAIYETSFKSISDRENLTEKIVIFQKTFHIVKFIWMISWER